MKKLLLIMAVSACASVARAEYVTYLAQVTGIDSSVINASLDVYNAADNTMLSTVKTANKDLFEDKEGKEGKGKVKQISFDSDTKAEKVYCIITTTTETGDSYWKSSTLTYGVDTWYFTPMNYGDDSHREAYWTLGSNPTSNGWTVATVPEPTSGLLMLLGMAGLALRRRRA